MSHSMKVRRRFLANKAAEDAKVVDKSWLLDAVFEAVRSEPMQVAEGRTITLMDAHRVEKQIKAAVEKLDLWRSPNESEGNLRHAVDQYYHATSDLYHGISELAERMLDPYKRHVRGQEVANQKQNFVKWFERIGRTLKALDELSPKPEALEKVFAENRQLVDDVIGLKDQPAAIVDTMVAEKVRLGSRTRAENEAQRSVRHLAPGWREDALARREAELSR